MTFSKEYLLFVAGPFQYAVVEYDDRSTAKRAYRALVRRLRQSKCSNARVELQRADSTLPLGRDLVSATTLSPTFKPGKGNRK